MGLKPLGIVKEAVEAAGMRISYVYEDLIFIDHNAFLLQFAEEDNTLLIHINEAAQITEINDALVRLKEEGSARELMLHDGGYYAISQKGAENIRLVFVEPD